MLDTNFKISLKYFKFIIFVLCISFLNVALYLLFFRDNKRLHFYFWLFTFITGFILKIYSYFKSVDFIQVFSGILLILLIIVFTNIYIKILFINELYDKYISALNNPNEIANALFYKQILMEHGFFVYGKLAPFYDYSHTHFDSIIVFIWILLGYLLGSLLIRIYDVYNNK